MQYFLSEFKVVSRGYRAIKLHKTGREFYKLSDATKIRNRPFFEIPLFGLWGQYSCPTSSNILGRHAYASYRGMSLRMRGKKA
jgi:hypothetical protein